jgi:2-keto-4-pentenoate hydratase
VRLVRRGGPLRPGDHHRGGALTASVADDVDTIAERIDDAHVHGRCLDSGAVRIPDLATAYAVQDVLTRRRLARGDALVGWKLGYTTEAMRAQMGIAAPNFGPLLASMHVRRALPPTSQPRVEPEIALILDRDPGADASAEEVLRCCRSAHLALEVVDSVWCGYRFDLEHNTADGSSAAGFALGDPLPLDVEGRWEVSLLRHLVEPRGAEREGGAPDASGLATMRAAAEATAWLATQLASRRSGLAPGDIVLTGGITPSHEVLEAHVEVVAAARPETGATATVSLFGSAA